MLTATAGFLLASQSTVNLGLLLSMLGGLALIIGAGCVINNYLDRDIDKKMSRTKQRALAVGAIPPFHALVFGILLALAGTAVLALFTNLLTLAVALSGLILYAGVYTHYKRHTVHGTLIGSLSGAVPPVAGYCAAANQIDGAAVILFLILVLWQMPHFYAIAIYRSTDYAAAGIPVLPIARGARAARLQILVYIVLFTGAALSLAFYNYTGMTYAVIVAILGITWFGIGLRKWESPNKDSWARAMFGYSLIVISGLCVAISVDVLLA